MRKVRPQRLGRHGRGSDLNVLSVAEFKIKAQNLKSEVATCMQMANDLPKVPVQTYRQAKQFGQTNHLTASPLPGATTPPNGRQKHTKGPQTSGDTQKQDVRERRSAADKSPSPAGRHTGSKSSHSPSRKSGHQDKKLTGTHTPIRSSGHHTPGSTASNWGIHEVQPGQPDGSGSQHSFTPDRREIQRLDRADPATLLASLPPPPLPPSPQSHSIGSLPSPPIPPIPAQSPQPHQIGGAPPPPVRTPPAMRTLPSRESRTRAKKPSDVSISF